MILEQDCVVSLCVLYFHFWCDHREFPEIQHCQSLNFSLKCNTKETLQNRCFTQTNYFSLCLSVSPRLTSSSASRHKRSRHQTSSSSSSHPRPGPSSILLLDTSVAPWAGGTLLETSFTSIPLPPPPPPAPRPTPSTTPFPGRRKEVEEDSSSSLHSGVGSLHGAAAQDDDGMCLIVKHAKVVKCWHLLPSPPLSLQVERAKGRRPGAGGSLSVVPPVSHRWILSPTSVFPGASPSLSLSCHCTTRPAAVPSAPGT